MSARGIGVATSCQTATNGYKNVAEKGDWAYSLTIANRQAEAGDIMSAILLFSRLSVMGIEPAQFNAAYLLGIIIIIFFLISSLSSYIIIIIIRKIKSMPSMDQTTKYDKVINI